MEDFAGVSLDKVLEEHRDGIDVTTFLKLAAKITECVTLLHQHHIIHQSLCPHHILWNKATDDVRLIDLGLSSELTQGFQISLHQKHVGKLLSYISPEQTGRINCPVDYRSDLYALGVTFYQLLTGVLPFSQSNQDTTVELDSMDIIYDIIAKAVVPTNVRKKNIPKPINDMIMKLLSKPSEERYQSTFGLRHDLRMMLSQPNNIENFKIATQDVKSTFRVSQKLYGRSDQVDSILRTFELISHQKISCGLVLVSGYSGVGKTSLVNEVYGPLARCRGYFIS
ncbi:hybrid signal transduction histidine kinase DhkG, partial [Acrasis kona]